jgi:pSer/pThr/pTyr-binding forkhead associated (FHA) protein
MDDTASGQSDTAARAAAPARVALIELQGRDGRPQQALPVLAWPLTIGRALDNDLVIDDPFVAAHHALLAPGSDGTLRLHVGNTHNGVQLGQRQLAAGAAEALPAGGTTLTLGQTTLRLRLPGEVLAPERRLQPTRGWAAPLVMAALLVALVLAGHWVSLDPGADTVAWLPTLATLPMLVALWCGGWALASKIFQHRFEFTAHLRIVLPWLLAIELVSVLLPPIAAGLGWPALWRLVQPLQIVLAALLVRQHLVHVLPQAERRVSLAVASALVVGGAISLALTHRATDRFSRPPYMSALPLPALNWATPDEPNALVQDLEPLAARLAERVRKAKDEERRDDGSDAE